MRIDLHNHTTRCCHAVGSMDAYVEAALANDIEEFGFSDHSHWMLHAKGPRYAMRPNEHEHYIADVRRLQARYRRDGAQPFRIRLGMEMDFIPSRLALAREAIARHDWDYVIGSVHHVGLGNMQGDELYATWPIEDICEVYFDAVGHMVRERFCDIVGHLDLPKKLGHRLPGGMLRLIEPLIPDLLANDIAVEINTSGIDAPAGEVMPGWDVIALLADRGVPLTLGSDAHAPDQVGRHFNAVFARLKQLGVRELVRFERRQMLAAPID